MPSRLPYTKHPMVLALVLALNGLIGQGPFALASPLSYRGFMKRILVADDNPMIRKMLCQIFKVEEDYTICAEATDGQEAIHLALKHRPDLIILDMSMPVLNGIEAAHELKKIMPGIPIILFTQHESMGRVILRTNKTIDCVVSKTDAETLMGHVRSLAPA